MKTEEIAKRLTELLTAGDYFGVYDELFHPDVLHIEPKSPSEAFRHIKGVEAIKKKDEAMGELIAEAEGPFLGEPIVKSGAIALSYKINIKFKDGNEMVLDEIIVYEVEEGKIISETFYY